MTAGARQRRWSYVLAICSSWGCEEKPRPGPAPPPVEAPKSTAPAPPPPRAAALQPFVPEDAAAPTESPSRERQPRPQPQVQAASAASHDATAPEGSVVGPFVVDDLVDVAEAGPATATERGVVMVNRDNHWYLAALGDVRGGPRPRATPLRSLPEAAGPFPLARGPAVRRGYAYWVSRGRLLRGALDAAGAGSAPEVLASDARVGTRVATPVGPRRASRPWPHLAAYVARAKQPEEPLVARLWVEGRAETVLLTEEAGSAHSVSLVATPAGLGAVFLEARTGMSSVHFRALELPASAEPSVGEDRVVWVGGPSRSSTEVIAQGSDSGYALGFMALERDVTHFGLFQLRIPFADVPLPLEPDWLLYENGIEPAPFAAATVCGRQVMALARPSSAVPHAPQELVVLERHAGGFGPGVVLARSRAFFEISLFSLGQAALLVYVADHRTWARTLRCAPA